MPSCSVKTAIPWSFIKEIKIPRPRNLYKALPHNFWEIQQLALKLYFTTQLVASSHGICKMGEKFLVVKEYIFSWGKIRNIQCGINLWTNNWEATLHTHMLNKLWMYHWYVHLPEDATEELQNNAMFFYCTTY